jgi:hypothetical protein
VTSRAKLKTSTATYVPDEEVIVTLTTSLPESYALLVVQLDAMGETDRTIGHVITSLIGEERRQAMNEDREDTPITLVARKACRDRNDITRFGCGRKGHYCSECPKHGQQGQAGRGAQPPPRGHSIDGIVVNSARLAARGSVGDRFVVHRASALSSIPFVVFVFHSTCIPFHFVRL